LSGGGFRLFYDDASGDRTEITSTLAIGYNSSSTLASGASIQATFPSPGPQAVRCILMYQGAIGANASSPLDPDDGSTAIAAVMLNLSPPPPPWRSAC
jgi:hypothetical protein